MALSARLKDVLCVCSRSSVRSAHRLQRKVLSTLANAYFQIALVLFSTAVVPNFAFAQENAGAPTEEIVVNLASGHVVIAVVKDAILIGTVETPIEPLTHVPTPVELGSERAGIILGAVDWFSPSSQKTLARLDRELPHLHSEIPGQKAPPHLAQSQGGDEAADIEVIGQGLLERLNGLALAIHGKLDMPAKEPIAQLIIADFLSNYGAEVWTATYTLKQSQQRGDFWATSVLRPVYLQFYPPEKGQPHTLLEFNYPSEGAAPTLLSLLQSGDPRLAKVKESDPKMAEVASRFQSGESNKALAADAIQFLRASLDAIAPPNSRQTMVVIQPETGVKWILAPPPEPQQPEKLQQQQRPPGAPTLAKPPSLRQ
jgi:hypothetical protein